MRSPTIHLPVITLFCVLALFSAKGFTAVLPSSSSSSFVLPTTSGLNLPTLPTNPGGPNIPVSGTPVPSKSFHSSFSHNGTLIPTSCVTSTPLPTGTIVPPFESAT